jgi:hypothetical protein
MNGVDPIQTQHDVEQQDGRTPKQHHDGGHGWYHDWPVDHVCYIPYAIANHRQ